MNLSNCHNIKKKKKKRILLIRLGVAYEFKNSVTGLVVDFL